MVSQGEVAGYILEPGQTIGERIARLLVYGRLAAKNQWYKTPAERRQFARWQAEYYFWQAVVWKIVGLSFSHKCPCQEEKNEYL